MMLQHLDKANKMEEKAESGTFYSFKLNLFSVEKNIIVHTSFTVTWLYRCVFIGKIGKQGIQQDCFVCPWLLNELYWPT